MHARTRKHTLDFMHANKHTHKHTLYKQARKHTNTHTHTVQTGTQAHKHTNCVIFYLLMSDFFKNATVLLLVTVDKCISIDRTLQSNFIKSSNLEQETNLSSSLHRATDLLTGIIVNAVYRDSVGFHFTEMINRI